MIYILLLLGYVATVLLALLALLGAWIVIATALDVHEARQKRANDQAVLDSLRKNRP